MSKKRKNSNTQAKSTAPAMDANHVKISNGAGRQPIVLDYQQGETYEQLFKRASVTVRSDQTVTTGKKSVKNFSDLVEAGSTIVIANKPNNG